MQAEAGITAPASASRASVAPSHSMSMEESLAILAHELRSPIGAIRNAVAVMESAGALPGAMERARRLVARQIGQLSVLVEDILDFAALARGTFMIRREWIDLVPEVEAAVESCSWALAGAGHSLGLQMPDAQVYAHVDPARIRQVITNLLDNACKYTQPFGRIHLTLERDGDHVELRVQDNGAGIASDRLPYVFDLFTRSGDTPESSTRGLGIGLALVREIVQLHEGAVEARSDGLGFGSTFVVRLPVVLRR
jgi:two-component system, chemotaxis family, CheB/CheR fusion protein